MSVAFAALAELFRYPDGPLDLAHVDLNDDARREIAALDRGQLQATYTSTFDLAPSCSPYLGAHLFGDEGPHRGRLLLGLRASYEKAGLRFDEGELPDHVAEVLAFAAHEEVEEWSDLVRLILVPALTKMDDLVRASSNPYRHLIAAARQTSEAALAAHRHPDAERSEVEGSQNAQIEILPLRCAQRQDDGAVHVGGE